MGTHTISVSTSTYTMLEELSERLTGRCDIENALEVLCQETKNLSEEDGSKRGLCVVDEDFEKSRRSKARWERISCCPVVWQGDVLVAILLSLGENEDSDPLAYRWAVYSEERLAALVEWNPNEGLPKGEKRSFAVRMQMRAANLKRALQQASGGASV